MQWQHIKAVFIVGKVCMDLVPFADESIWIIHQILPEDREAVLSILFAYQKRAEAAADARAAAATQCRCIACRGKRKLPTS